MKLVNFNFKMPADIKKQFEDFSDKVGLTMSGIFNAFVRKTLSDNKLPFEISATSDLQKWADNFKISLQQRIVMLEETKENDYNDAGIDRTFKEWKKERNDRKI